MFKITKTPKTPNIIWDNVNNCPLCRFVNGAFETNDKVIASKLAALGHVVEGEADEKPLDKMRADELKAYAAEHNIELPEGAQKNEILKTIQEAEAKD